MRKYFISILFILCVLGIYSQNYSFKVIVDNIVDLYPDFVPFKVYSWQLEKDKKVKGLKYKNLKNKYPNHWDCKADINFINMYTFLYLSY